jgi:hypothetical protein
MGKVVEDYQRKALRQRSIRGDEGRKLKSEEGGMKDSKASGQEATRRKKQWVLR